MRIDKSMEAQTLKEFIMIFESPERRYKTQRFRMWLALLIGLGFLVLGVRYENTTGTFYLFSGFAFGMALIFYMAYKQIPIITKHIEFNTDRAKATLARRLSAEQDSDGNAEKPPGVERES